jgi:hypothetical protein
MRPSGNKSASRASSDPRRRGSPAGNCGRLQRLECAGASSAGAAPCRATAVLPARTNRFAQQLLPGLSRFRDQNTTFSGVAAYRIAAAGLSKDKIASPIWLYEASGNYFDVAEVQPFLGRFFHSSDEHGAGTAPYTVLSYGYWQSHFGGDLGIVGKTVEINKQPLNVIGIAPPAFHGTELFLAPDLWVAMMNEEQIDGWNIWTRAATI